MLCLTQFSIKIGIKMRSLTSSEIRNVALIVFVSMFIVACGGSNQVPAGSTVVISPDSNDFSRTVSTEPAIVGGQCSVGEIREDQLITISVRGPSGEVITNADITVSLGFSGNTSNVTFLELYDDVDGDGVPDENGLVSGPEDPLFMTKTSSSSGEKYLVVRAYYGCTTFSATLTVAASTAVGTASFSYDLTVEQEEAVP